MNVALIGASGNAGSRILAELVRRGHAVTAIARNPSRISAGEGVRAVGVDLHDLPALIDALRGHDAVISSVHFTASDADKLIGAVKASGVQRYLVVGGAGSLEVALNKRVIDTPDFPAAYRDEAQGGIDFLDKLRGQHDLDWTFLSPSAVFTAGERTGTFRLGKDQLLTNPSGSSITFEDYAIALIDELETAAHVGKRFTVGY